MVIVSLLLMYITININMNIDGCNLIHSFYYLESVMHYKQNSKVS
jgi:hypothetical protein